MHLHVQPEWQFDARDGPGLQLRRIGDDEFALHLRVVVGDTDEVAVAFG